MRLHLRRKQWIQDGGTNIGLAASSTKPDFAMPLVCFAATT